MIFSTQLRLLIVGCIFFGLTNSLRADPCGMVPPIHTGPVQPIKRVGLQQTYVFYKDGVETFGIRPGYEGKVDEFGMLIPFPKPPALRKMPDAIFDHIANAIDPPEVVVHVQEIFLEQANAAFNAPVQQSAPDPSALKYDAVRVVRQEAVGMYEVAVLEAGSAAALKNWMDKHGYKYPDGMDEVCEEYVEDRWCFVAVKTKVGQKDGVDPRPAQRDVNSKLPDGSTFDGHVQAMGFRFETDELVVPMRLSAFNEGELRNIVYLLTDSPKKSSSIPEEYVVRQISGEQLIHNVTQPLPLRIIGGGLADIPEYRRKTLPTERNPEPHNGAARDAFASDLLAVSSGKLSLDHEEAEKNLLNIGERLGLRGTEIDALHEEHLAHERKIAVASALDSLKEMSLTVVDGDFPREVLARKNLRFGEYKMPARRNKAEVYDVKSKQPAGKQPGVRHVGTVDWEAVDEQIAATQSTLPQRSRVAIAEISTLALLGILFAMTGIALHNQRKRKAA